MGLSPTLPGFLKGVPPVDTPIAKRPLVSKQTHPTVPIPFSTGLTCALKALLAS